MARLINVRLDEARIRKARALRRRGVVLSDLVREAIDARFDTLARTQEPLDARQMIDRLFEEHPDPPELPARDFEPHDRRQAQAAIRSRLARKRP